MKDSIKSGIEPRTTMLWEDFSPRNWPLWILVFLLFLLCKLPYDFQLTLGRGVGRLLHILNANKRRSICHDNLRRIYPDWSEVQIQRFTRQHFESVGMGLAETAFCWWGNFSQLKGRYTLEDCHYIDEAQAKGRGVICWWPHFTTVDIAGKIIATQYPIISVYKENRNPTIDRLQKYQREKTIPGHIGRSNIKLMIRSLKLGNYIWFSSDQNFVDKGWIDVPLLNHKAPSNNATSRIAKISGAPVVPFVTERNFVGGKVYYIVRFLPPPDDFPSNDDYADICKFHRIIEAHIAKKTVDYLWIHQRWKRPYHEGRETQEDKP